MDSFGYVCIIPMPSRNRLLNIHGVFSVISVQYSSIKNGVTEVFLAYKPAFLVEEWLCLQVSP